MSLLEDARCEEYVRAMEAHYGDDLIKRGRVAPPCPRRKFYRTRVAAMAILIVYRGVCKWITGLNQQ